MVICAAFGCNSRLKKGCGVSFFSFPPARDKTRREIWRHYCRRVFDVQLYHKLCSRHFSREQYSRDPVKLSFYGYSNPQARLREDAFPDVPLVDQPHKKQQQRTAVTKRRNAEKLREALETIDRVYTTPVEVTENSDCITLTEDTEMETEPDDSEKPLISPPTFLSKKTQVRLFPPQRNRSSQTDPLLMSKQSSKREIGIQCSLLSPEPLVVSSHVDEVMSDDDDDDDDDDVDDVDVDVDYIPNSEEDEEDEDSGGEDKHSETSLSSDCSPDNERQFMVSETALCKLLSICQICGGLCSTSVNYVSGCMLCTKSVCEKGHCTEWHSQSVHGSMPWGNLMTAAAIFVTGLNSSSALRFLANVGMPTISQRTFMRLQSHYLIPTTISCFKQHQTSLIENLDGRSVTIGGDGRCDSPGYSAKYGSYTVMDLDSNKILDVQLVQSNEVKNSSHMELEGLKRCFRFLEGEKRVAIDSLVTDRHVMIKKYMREEHPTKTHFFDVWHLAKGISKKLETAAKKKNGAEIRPWIKSVTNHCYWVASSCGRDEDMKVAKWCSITNHVANEHEGHSSIFPVCQHEPLQGNRLWLVKGSVAHQLMTEIVESPFLLRDIRHLSPVHQTYGLEVFHSVLNHFAPKSTHFYYPAMLARLYLSAIHYNENSGRPQALTQDGEMQWCVSYPKAKKGASAVVKPRKTEPTYDYVAELKACFVQRRRLYTTYSKAGCDGRKGINFVPPSLTKSFPTYDKRTLIDNHKSRYHVNEC